MNLLTILSGRVIFFGHDPWASQTLYNTYGPNFFPASKPLLCRMMAQKNYCTKLYFTVLCIVMHYNALYCTAISLQWHLTHSYMSEMKVVLLNLSQIMPVCQQIEILPMAKAMVAIPSETLMAMTVYIYIYIYIYL